MSDFTERELVDFLDGKLSGLREAELAAALEQDPHLEMRLMALDPVAPVVRDAFNDLGAKRDLDKVLPVLNTVSRTPLAWRPRLMAASVAVGLLVLGAFSLQNRGSDAADWMQQVAAYQALYSPETIEGVTSTQGELMEQISRAETALGTALPKEALSRIAGLELRRTQMLAYKGRPLAQIVFADDQGLPIALCILMTDEAPQGDIMDAERLHGLESVAFSDEGYGFLLIGPTNASTLIEHADTIRAALAQG